MRDRIRIRRTGPAQWTATVPTIGFGSPDAIVLPTHTAAIRAADQRIQRPGSTDLTTETCWQHSDRVTITPAWSPLKPEE